MDGVASVDRENSIGFAGGCRRDTELTRLREVLALSCEVVVLDEVICADSL